MGGFYQYLVRLSLVQLLLYNFGSPTPAVCNMKQDQQTRGIFSYPNVWVPAMQSRKRWLSTLSFPIYSHKKALAEGDQSAGSTQEYFTK